MSLTANPLLKFQVTGTSITPVDMSTTFALALKSETSHSLHDSTPEIELDLSNVTNKKFLIFQGTGDFIIHMYKTVEAPVSHETFSYSFDILVNDGFGFTLHTLDDFFDDIDKITISTTSINVITVQVACYGEVVTV